MIVESERDGCQDVAQAMRLLDAFLVLQRSREEHRARILDELYDVRFGSKADSRLKVVPCLLCFRKRTFRLGRLNVR